MKQRQPIKRQLKQCTSCKKPRVIWSRGRCQACASKLTRSGKNVKGKFAKTTENVAFISDKEIDTVFSWLVRTLYPEKCHACQKKSIYSKLEACHMIKRGLMGVRWDLRNVFPGCWDCNHDDQFHVVYLKQTCDKLYGEGTAEELHRLSKEVCKWPNFMRKELYDTLTKALLEAQKPGADKDEIRLRVIELTKRVL